MASHPVRNPALALLALGAGLPTSPKRPTAGLPQGRRPVARAAARCGDPRRAASFAGCAWLLLLAGTGWAAPAWEYAPYRVQVWIALADSGELPDVSCQQIAQSLERQADVAAGSAWDLHAGPAPPELRGDIVVHLAGLQAATIQDAVPKLLKEHDKLLLVCVQAGMAEFVIQARELDCTTRFLSPVVRHTAASAAAIPEACFAAVCEAFVPLGRIESATSSEVRVRIRAGGLIQDEQNVAWIRDTDALQIFFRRDDRHGEPLPNGIQLAPWTYLTIGEREGQLLTCTVRSGVRVSLDTPAAARARKFALAVRPRHEATVLRVQSQGKTPLPLAGYEVSVRDPDSEKTEVIGPTDWRGEVRIPRTAQTLRMVYVRNAGQLLARLPMVPGLEREQTARVINDDPRLLAEGYVKGLQNRVMDLVATRQLYLARFRRLLEKQDFVQARRLLDEFRRMETRSDLTRQLDQQQQRLACPDRRVQAKIDKLFNEARQTLGKFLDPYTANALAQDLAQAQQRAAGKAKAPPEKPSP
jgi:hypothetical protein